MHLYSGIPFWLVKNGLSADYPRLDHNLENEEVVIIGSGISGALSAYFLGKAGFRCTILDKRLLSGGSTVASTAHLNYEIDASLKQLIEWYGSDFAIQVYKASLDSVEIFSKIAKDTGLQHCMEPKESLCLATDKKAARDLEKESQLRNHYNIPSDFIPAAQLYEIYKMDRPGAIRHSHAAQLDPYRMTVGLIGYCSQHFNLSVYTRTDVDKMNPSYNGVRLQTRTGFTVQARHVICAAGYESGKFIPESIGRLTSTYVVATAPVEESLLWKNKCIIWESGRPYLYIRSTPDNRIMIGGKDEPFKDEKKRDALLLKKKKQLLRSCKELFPHINVEADFYWCGTFGDTEDTLPYIGKYPGIDDVYFSMGFGGNGTSYSVIAAGIICNEIRGIEDPGQKLFSFSRKRKY